MTKIYFSFFQTLLLLLFFSSCKKSKPDELNLNEFVTEKPTLSYYVPAYGTVDLSYWYQPKSGPVLDFGYLDIDMIVLNDVGGYISRVNSDGSVAWTVNERPFTPFSLFKIDDSRFGYIVEEEIVVLDYEGKVLNTINPLGKIIRFIKKLEDGRYLLCITSNSDNNIAILNSEFNLVKVFPIVANYPRSADLKGSILAVADTFNHKVKIYDSNSNVELASMNEFFPNEVIIKNSSEVWVLGEHSNRLLMWNFLNGTRQLIFSYQGHGYDNPYLSVDEIRQIEHSGALHIEPSKLKTSKSKASVEYSGYHTLYSPNGMMIVGDGTVLIADTDNHRVIRIKEDGQLIFSISGFNNPSSILMVPAEN